MLLVLLVFQPIGTFVVFMKPHKNIFALELFPVVVTFEIWEACFVNEQIIVHTDIKGVFFLVTVFIAV